MRQDTFALVDMLKSSTPQDGLSGARSIHLAWIEGMRMDVVAAPGASNCDYEGWPAVLAASIGTIFEGHQLVEMPIGHRMRLLDLPEEISARILAVAIVAPEQRFEQVVEAAAPIVASVEFHTK